MSHSIDSQNQQTALDPAQREALGVVLNLIIPPSEDGRLPGVAHYDLWEYICTVAGQLAQTIRNDLDRLDQHANARLGKPLAALTRADAQLMVDELRVVEPDFMADLVRQTFSCYYQQDRVLEAIGMEARAPYPKGFEVAPGDFSLLDPVRGRADLYLKV